jgi:threonine dehydrogenase-like Zn-dependent dehydrogenase
VVVRPSFICGDCPYCLRGDFRLCAEHFRQTIGVGADGAFADRVLIEDYMAIPLPPGTSLERAALIEPLACGVLATRIADVDPADRAVVLGAGPIGLGVIACLRLAGAATIVVFEPSPKRRELALELGADHAAELSDDPTEDEWLGRDGADLVFECAGVPATVGAAVEMARPEGTIVVTALFDTPQPVDLSAVVRKALVVRGAIGSRADDFKRAVDLVASGEVAVERMVTEVVDLERTDEAIANLHNPATTVKVLVRPGYASATESPGR